MLRPIENTSLVDDAADRALSRMVVATFALESVSLGPDQCARLIPPTLAGLAGTG